MRITFNPRKNEWNIRERDLPFEEALLFDWEHAAVVKDDRQAYPEPRYVAYGLIGDRLHVICFTPIVDGMHIISMRKANKREVKRYGQKTFD